MKNPMYSILDLKAAAFLQPFTVVNAAVARRSIAGAVNNREHMFGQVPEDFAMYHIADFDEATGVITPLSPIVLECTLVSLLLKNKE